jgi:hypothetical protein
MPHGKTLSLEPLAVAASQNVGHHLRRWQRRRGQALNASRYP